MFTKEISALNPCLSPPLYLSAPFALQSDALEFQYDLCQIFLKKTGEQLQQKEAELMVSSQALISTIRRRESEKDLCSSTDSGSEEVIPSEQEEETSSHFNTFKRPEGIAWRKVENRLGPCLAEIEENCSALCVANIRGVMGEYRQLVQRWWEVEAREGLMDRKQRHWQREHEENLILKQRLSSQSLKLETMECEVECLKQKNQTILDYANQRLQELLGSQRFIEINGKVYRDIKNYLDDKERNAASRVIRAQCSYCARRDWSRLCCSTSRSFPPPPARAAATCCGSSRSRCSSTGSTWRRRADSSTPSTTSTARRSSPRAPTASSDYLFSTGTTHLILHLTDIINRMQMTITQRLAERLIAKKQNVYSSRENAKSINEELLEMVGHIRSLEDQLLAEQYRQELLLEQNTLYKSQLEKLNSRNELQRHRISTLEEQWQVHSIKNRELQACEDSLKAIYKEINDLTKVVEDRAEECELVVMERGRLAEENQAISEHNADLQHKADRISSAFHDFLLRFAEQPGQFSSANPVSDLRLILAQLREELEGLENESSRLHREGSTVVTVEREAVIKLEFEYELLKARARDEDKLERLSEICTSESNLESVVEEMLVKEDELVDRLSHLEKEHRRVEKQYQAMLEGAEFEQEEAVMRAQNQARGLLIQRDRLRSELKQVEYKVSTKTHRYEQIYQEQEMTLKMDINLNSLKRLRQVEQRNKHLKMKINELEETRALLVQEKELLYSS